MATSNYMPEVRCEVAFNAGYTTPAASRTWTDITDYVELEDGIEIGFGRQDERAVADANSLALTLDNSDGRFTAGGQWLANVVRDPNMDNTGSWGPLPTATAYIGSQGNAPGQNNGKALSISTNGTYQSVNEPRFAVTVGDTWEVGAYCWVQGGATGTGTHLVTLFFYDAGGAFLGTLGSSTWSSADAGAGWIYRSHTGTVPANAVGAEVTIRDTTTQTSGIYLTDAVSARKANPYYPNVKLGRPIRVTATPNTNLHPNGGVETNADGWYPNTVFGEWGTAALARSTTRAHAGSASLLITWTTHAVAEYVCANTTTTLTPGETYTASAWVWVPSGSPDPRVEVVFETPGARTSLKDQWVFLTCTFTATGTNRNAGIQVATPTNGTTCYVDEFMVNRGTTALPYTNVTAAPIDRFTGFVDEWPVEWDGTETYARAKIRASSRLARLGLNANLRSMPEEQILSSSPARYWTMGDPQGSTTASESSGNNGLPLESQNYTSSIPITPTPVIFGNATGPPTDEMTAVEFTGHDPNTAPCLRLGLNAGAEAIGIPKGFRFTLRIGTLPVSDYTIGVVQTIGGGAPGGMLIRVLTSGVVTVCGLSCGNLNDGLTHDIAIVWPSTTTYLVVDGVQVASGNTSTVTTSGNVYYVLMGMGLTGAVSHFAVWNDQAAPSVAIAQEINDTMTAAGMLERTDQRLARILSWAGIAATEITTETGTATMSYQKTSGGSIVDALRECESTENGVLFDGRDGKVTFHNRSHRYNRAVSMTLDMRAQHVGSDYLPKLDRTTLTNDVTVENPTTSLTARLFDATSLDEYGVAAASITSLEPDVASLQARAAWTMQYAQPAARVPTLSVDVVAHQGLSPSAASLLNLTMGDVLAVTNSPGQAATATPSYFVEGATEAIGPESYTITFNLSPGEPELNVFKLDTSTFDGSNVLGL